MDAPRDHAADGTRMDKVSPPVTMRNIQTIAELEAKSHSDRSVLGHISDQVSAFAGSPTFIAIHVFWFASWVTFNLFTAHPVDPYPFTFLTFLVSLEAIFLTSFLLISQTQLEESGRRRSALDLQINLLAEAEMTKMLATVRAIAEHLGLRDVCNDPDVRSMVADTDIAALARAVDATVGDNASSSSGSDVAKDGVR